MSSDIDRDMMRIVLSVEAAMSVGVPDKGDIEVACISPGPLFGRAAISLERLSVA